VTMLSRTTPRKALISGIIGCTGRIVFDPSDPDRTPRRLLDLSRIENLGWHAQIPLDRGVASTYQWYLSPASQEVSAVESRTEASAISQLPAEEIKMELGIVPWFRVC